MSLHVLLCWDHAANTLFVWRFIPVLNQVQTQVEQLDEKHNISGKIAGAAMTAQAKVQEVDTK